MSEYGAYWCDPTTDESCATCQYNDGHKCELFGVAFGKNEIYVAKETKCTAFTRLEGVAE